jgi:hypothetical protein
MATARATADTRYSFTAQFLCSSAIFARRCAEIERADPDEQTRTEHLGLVTAAIMQCTAAVEAESAELTIHGPGHHLGSNGIDKRGRDILVPLAKLIDRQEVMERYTTILHLLGKRPLSSGNKPSQYMAILVKVRNELVHYKSQWGEDMKRKDLFKALQQLQLSKPPFVSPYTNFFPHQFMSAACAAWSVRTAVTFLDAVYERLEIISPLDPYRTQFEGL